MEPLIRRLGVAAALFAVVLAYAPLANAAGSSIDVLSVDTTGAQVATVVTPPSPLAGQDLTR